MFRRVGIGAGCEAHPLPQWQYILDDTNTDARTGCAERNTEVPFRAWWYERIGRRAYWTYNITRTSACGSSIKTPHQKNTRLNTNFVYRPVGSRWLFSSCYNTIVRMTFGLPQRHLENRCECSADDDSPTKNDKAPQINIVPVPSLERAGVS